MQRELWLWQGKQDTMPLLKPILNKKKLYPKAKNDTCTHFCLNQLFIATLQSTVYTYANSFNLFCHMKIKKIKEDTFSKWKWPSSPNGPNSKIHVNVAYRTTVYKSGVRAVKYTCYIIFLFWVILFFISIRSYFYWFFSFFIGKYQSCNMI